MIVIRRGVGSLGEWRALRRGHRGRRRWRNRWCGERIEHRGRVMRVRRNGGKCWGERRRGVMIGVEIVDLSEEVVIALAFGAGDAVFDKFDYRGGLVDDLNVAGADNESTTGREKADDWVVPLVAKDVTQFPTRTRGLGVGVGNFEEGYLPRVYTGPTGIVQAFAIKVL